MKPTEQHFELRIRFKTVSKSGDHISAALFRIELEEGFPGFLEKRLPFHKVSPGSDYAIGIEVVEPIVLEELMPDKTN
jgi:hypothetical protein